MGVTLELTNVACGYSGVSVVKDITFKVLPHEVLCLLGPNGVGKTTLFKTILGFLKRKNGSICMDGKDILKWTRSDLARVMGYVPQAHTPPFPFSVIDVVVMGRSPHIGMFSAPSKEDFRIAESSLHALGIFHLRDKVYTHISGGERQMVMIARAMTQEAGLLIMDEPTSNLDFGNQVRVIREIIRLAKRGHAIILTTHFPGHAFLCATKVALLKKGQCCTIGSVDDVINEENLKKAYGVNVSIFSTGNSEGLKACVPRIES